MEHKAPILKAEEEESISTDKFLTKETALCRSLYEETCYLLITLELMQV
jgi:hypothetical protein